MMSVWSVRMHVCHLRWLGISRYDRVDPHDHEDNGFGWNLDPDNGSVWHAGSSPGFETLLTMIPDQRGEPSP